MSEMGTKGGGKPLGPLTAASGRDLSEDCVSKKEMMDGPGYFGFIILIVGRNNCKMFLFSFLCSRDGCNRILLPLGTDFLLRLLL